MNMIMFRCRSPAEAPLGAALHHQNIRRICWRDHDDVDGGSGGPFACAAHPAATDGALRRSARACGLVGSGGVGSDRVHQEEEEEKEEEEEEEEEEMAGGARGPVAWSICGPALRHAGSGNGQVAAVACPRRLCQ
ncbi:unnamed protein product [Prorocentrum cordatum]|uniref:Subtilisin n=1 Tax=Prorocentrum cordatum TaxID=2364126 RepID=A0ABN9VPM8_9DINO|nr:unnamed protein product [Polarella glacialis]